MKNISTDSIDSTRHVFFMPEGKEEEVTANVDKFGDSYARDTTVDELKDVRTPLSARTDFE